MSRLDSMIRRLTAQKVCIHYALDLISDLGGPILELGLGNGRTYDHLREHSKGREIFVFERKPAAHPSCTPAPQFLFEGDFRDTLTGATGTLKLPAAFAHCDIGSGVSENDRALARAIAYPLNDLLISGAVVLSDQELHVGQWRSIDLPNGVSEGRYFLYRKFEEPS
ncbi:MAG: hypothetical protein HOM87_02810 [Proteobacteria bacterium]|jgi:hypothetical protein|nr:hypothetical protein [Pseudomonadota bacterium]MDB4826833.1 class I SAM-dependent methyltransferase [Gammaproteobacteria bacterium]